MAFVIRTVNRKCVFTSNGKKVFFLSVY